MRSIVLSGFMGCGKSTVGALLAARLGVPFVDTDARIAEEAGVNVPELWRRDGEAAFREREAALVTRLFADDVPRVLAFGGGTVTLREIRHLAAERAVLVTLTAEPPTILKRVGDTSTRPALDGPDPEARVVRLLEQRADVYAECHGAIATDGREPRAIVEDIVALATRDPMLVPLGRRSYGIELADDEPERVAAVLARAKPSCVVAVTDANVQRARGAALESALATVGVPSVRVTLPPGEAYKTLASVSTIWDAALGAGLDRDAVVLAFGGGVVGDLAGFAASTLLRGVRVVQAPTTLLAMVDASVGGKTGFDHPAGKNLVGTFRQPHAVVLDLAHLSTLPARERAAGLAEVVKIALVVDEVLLDDVERAADDLARGDRVALAPIVRRAVAAKIRIVRDDERELGARALLNLGHTVGHALEASGGYTRLLHGEAVAIGTVAELQAGVALGHTPAPLAARARALFARVGLPTEASRGELVDAWPFVAADKKRARTAVRLPVVVAAGHGEVVTIPLDALRAALIP